MNRQLQLLVLGFVVACGDPAVGLDAGDPDAGSVTADAGSMPTDAGSMPTDAASADSGTSEEDAGVFADAGSDAAVGDGGSPDRALLAINELRASGDDWVELHYRGVGSLSLAGLKITDADDDGTARIARAVTIPEGVEIASGEFFVIVADQDENSTALETDCQLEGVDRCVFADWGLSAGGGDTIFLLDASDDVLASEVYPPDAIGDAPDATWAREVDGDGAFVVSVPTPSAPNLPIL